MQDDEIAPNQNVPTHLFKYKSLSGHSKGFAKQIISDSSLYFSRPNELNDPFEFMPVLDMSASDDQWKAYAKRLTQLLHAGKPREERRRIEKELLRRKKSDVLKQSYSTVMGKVGVFSLSAKSDDLLMWPHYASNHTGICIQFNMASLLGHDTVPMPVVYQTERPTVRPISDEPLEMFRKAALTKGLPWAYESEWRLLRNRGGGQVFDFERPVVTGVILGARISDDDRRDVMGWARECGHHVDLFQARFHERKYALEIDPVA